MDNSQTKTLSYEAPEVKVLEVTVEQGFAISGGYDNNISGWGDGGSFEDSIY